MSVTEKRFTAKVEIKAGMTKQDRDEVIIAHLPFIKSVCRGVVAKVPRLQVEDILGVAVMGFMDALSRYDASRDNKFQTFAEHRVRGAIVDELRATDTVSRYIRDMKKKIDSAKAAAESIHGPDFRSEDAAAQLGVSLGTFFEMERKSAKERTVPLYGDHGGGDGGKGALKRDHERDVVKFSGRNSGQNGEELLLLKDIRRAVDNSLGYLDETETLVVSLHHFEDLRFSDIGDLLGYSEARAGHIHSCAITKLARAFRAGYGADDRAKALKTLYCA